MKKYEGGKNMGGVNRIQYCPIEDVDSIPAVQGVVITGPVVFKATKGWLDMYATPGTMQYEIDVDDSDNCDIGTIKLIGTTPKLTPVIESILQDLPRHKYLVRFWDNNRYCRIIGNKQTPVNFKVSSATGATGAASNGSKFEFSNQQLGRIPYYYQPGVVDFPNAEDASVL